MRRRTFGRALQIGFQPNQWLFGFTVCQLDYVGKWAFSLYFGPVYIDMWRVN